MARNSLTNLTLPKRYRLLTIGAVLLFLLSVGTSHAQIRIVLKNSFIKAYENRATIDAAFTVDASLPHPHTASEDADLHIAGRAPEIELPTVAEIMNALTDTESVNRIHDAQGTGSVIHITGAWRIWCEHGGEDAQIQGTPLSPIQTTNPAHVFEIHPMTRIEDRSLLGDLHPISGYKTKDADEAFGIYESVRCHIQPGPDTTEIDTAMAGFNYVEFQIKLLEDPQQVIDGTKVFAAVYDLHGEKILNKRRMWFIKDSPPEMAVRALHAGDQMHVLGTPRIDLTLVLWRSTHQDIRGVLDWNLPYEMIIDGVYPGSPGPLAD